MQRDPLEQPLVALFTFLVQGATAGASAAVSPADWVLHGGRLHRASQDMSLAPAAGPDDEESVPASAPVVAAPAPAFPRSAAKVWRMLDRLRQQGFTSFIE